MIARSFLAIALICGSVPAKAADDAGALQFWRQAQRQPEQQHPSRRRSIPLPPDVGGIRGAIARSANAHGVPVHLAMAVVRIESGFNCRARNASGATGIMQVFKATARSVGVHGDLLNCETGLSAGMKYLKLALNRGGHGCAGVSLFESGIYARLRCSPYGRRVMSYAAGYR